MLKTFTLIVVIYSALSHGFHIQPKVLNGAVSNPADFPYFVWIYGEILCCGSLITDTYVDSSVDLLIVEFVKMVRFLGNCRFYFVHSWVLTAGHCMENRSPFNVSIGMRPDGSHETTVMVDVHRQHIYSKEYEKDYYDIGALLMFS